MNRKQLLATTALAAAAQFGLAAPAMAAGWEMSVGGYMEQWFGYTKGAVRDNEGFDEQTDAEIHFEPSITLDNGIQIGVDVQLEAQTEDDQIDQQYAWVEGSFGRLEMGSNDSAPYLMAIGIASAGLTLDSGDLPDWIGGPIDGLLITTTFNMTAEEDSSEKINYFTPRFAGFQLGVSYIPQLNQDLDGVSGANAPRENDGVRDNAFGIGLNYQRSFNDFSVGASVGYVNFGDDDAAVGDTPEDIGVGLSLGYSGLTFTAAYNYLDDGTTGDLETYGVGLMYEFGDFGVSLGYIHGDDDESEADSDAFELGAYYTLGPGVAAHFSFFYVDQDTPFGGDLEGAAAVGGLALSF